MKRILYVDDDPAMLRAVGRALSAHGWLVETSTAPVPVAGYAVVLSDWSPHGNRMCWLCKAVGVPVVVLTAEPDAVDLPVQVISKPFDADELDAVLSAAVGVKP